MAMEEKQHAGLLQFCVANTLFASDLPGEIEIQKTSALFERLEKRAAEPKLTLEDAFRIAIEMETTEVNDIYGYLTTTLHSSVYLLRRKIALGLPDHVDELIRAAAMFGIKEEVMREFTHLKQQGKKLRPAS